jgi:hypothetical protein
MSKNEKITAVISNADLIFEFFLSPFLRIFADLYDLAQRIITNPEIPLSKCFPMGGAKAENNKRQPK